MSIFEKIRSVLIVILYTVLPLGIQIIIGKYIGHKDDIMMEGSMPINIILDILYPLLVLITGGIFLNF